MADYDELMAQVEVARESGDAAQACSLLERALQNDPQNLRLIRQLGWELASAKQYAAALEIVQSIDETTANPEQFSRLDGLRALCFYRLDRLPEAERYFRLALEHEESWSTWHLLASVLWRVGREEESMECCRRALKIKPANEEILLQLAEALIHRHENLAESEELLRRAIAIKPDYAAAWSALGQLLRSKYSATRVTETLQEARLTLRRALYLEPNDIWARIHFGNTLWVCKELEAAEENYRRAYHDVPDDDEILHFAAGALLADFLSAEQINSGFAEQLLRAAIAHDTEDVNHNYILGKHLYRYERDDEARPFLQFAAAHGHERAAKLLRELKAPE